MKGDADSSELQRCISLPMMVLFSLGNIIGAGIYVLIGEITAISGYLAPVSFFISSLIVAFTVFSYAELSARYPKAAGAALYVDKAFSSLFLSRLVGFIIITAGLVSAAAILQGFAGYLQVFVEMPRAAVIIAVSLLMGVVAVTGIGLSVAVVSLFTLVETGGLILVCYVSWPYLDQYAAGVIQQTQLFDFSMMTAIFAGALLAFYAYTGFEDMVSVAEEVKQPEITMPRAAILTLIISTLLYIAVSVSVVAVLGVDNPAGNSAPMADVFEQATGKNPVVISLIALFAVINGAMIQLIMVSRVLYGMASRGWLPAKLRYVHPVRRTPVITIAITVSLLIVAALSLQLVTLARITSLLILVIFVLVNAALWRIKWREEQAPEYAYPVWLPITATFLSLAFLVVQLL